MGKNNWSKEYSGKLICHKKVCVIYSDFRIKIDKNSKRYNELEPLENFYNKGFIILYETNIFQRCLMSKYFTPIFTNNKNIGWLRYGVIKDIFLKPHSKHTIICNDCDIICATIDSGNINDIYPRTVSLKDNKELLERLVNTKSFLVDMEKQFGYSSLISSCGWDY